MKAVPLPPGHRIDHSFVFTFIKAKVSGETVPFLLAYIACLTASANHEMPVSRMSAMKSLQAILSNRNIAVLPVSVLNVCLSFRMLQ